MGVSAGFWGLIGGLEFFFSDGFMTPMLFRLSFEVLLIVCRVSGISFWLSKSNSGLVVLSVYCCVSLRCGFVMCELYPMELKGTVLLSTYKW